MTDAAVALVRCVFSETRKAVVDARAIPADLAQWWSVKDIEIPLESKSMDVRVGRLGGGDDLVRSRQRVSTSSKIRNV